MLYTFELTEDQLDRVSDYLDMLIRTGTASVHPRSSAQDHWRSNLGYSRLCRANSSMDRLGHSMILDTIVILWLSAVAVLIWFTIR